MTRKQQTTRTRQVTRTRRWPTPEQVIENARTGLIDDTTARVSPFDLEPWEILGTASPSAAAPEPGTLPSPPPPPADAAKRVA